METSRLLCFPGLSSLTASVAGRLPRPPAPVCAPFHLLPSVALFEAAFYYSCLAEDDLELRFFHLCLPSAGITGLCYDIWLFLPFSSLPQAFLEV